MGRAAGLAWSSFVGMLIDIVTIFPQLFESALDYGMICQARKKALLQVDTVDLRSFATDKHRSVDDRPYGGGEGMVLKPEPLFRAVQHCREKTEGQPRVLFMTPQGRRFDQAKAVELSAVPHLTFVCGRYEGIDQRAVDGLADEELSIGDFVLSGGEFAALAIIDSVTRLIPGVVGREESVLNESFMDGLLDCPHYTRPADLRGNSVPEVLLSGNHEEIRQWREGEALKRTRQRRPDLLKEERLAKART